MTITTEPESSVEQQPAPKSRSLRRRVLTRSSIQSKLLRAIEQRRASLRRALAAVGD
jgi:hypothetical protein